MKCFVINCDKDATCYSESVLDSSFGYIDEKIYLCDEHYKQTQYGEILIN